MEQNENIDESLNSQNIDLDHKTDKDLSLSDNLKFIEFETQNNSITNNSNIEKSFIEVKTKLNSFQLQLDEISSFVVDFTYKDDINNRLHEELQKHKNGLRKDIITPLLKAIIREYDRNIRMIKFYKKDSDTNENFRNLLTQFEITSSGLLEILFDNDLEPLEVIEGEQYSAKEHRVLSYIETDVFEKDNTVSSCEVIGFKDTSTGHVIRKPEVMIFKQKLNNKYG